MQTAGNLSTQGLKKITQGEQRHSSQRTTTGERKDIINHLFGYLKVAYPNFLKGQDEIPAKRLWYVQLESYTGEQIKAALSLSIERYPTFAPTIGEFKSLLKESRAVKPGAMIELAPICPSCRSTRNSQHHQDFCGEV
jgi:hypothetical protein